MWVAEAKARATAPGRGTPQPTGGAGYGCRWANEVWGASVVKAGQAPALRGLGSWWRVHDPPPHTHTLRERCSFPTEGEGAPCECTDASKSHT